MQALYLCLFNPSKKKDRKGEVLKFYLLLSPLPPPFHFLALVSFLARSKPKVPVLGLSLLRNQTKTLATQAKV